MKDKTAFIVSAIVHVGIFLYLAISLPAKITFREAIISVNLEQFVKTQPTVKPQPTTVPTPEPPKPKPTKPPKVKDQTIKDLENLLKTPTPTPKRKPTPTPTKKKPTKRPTRKPMPKPTAKPTPTPKVIPPTPTPEIDWKELDDPVVLTQAAKSQIKDTTAPMFFQPGGNFNDVNFNDYVDGLKATLSLNWYPPRVRSPQSRDYTAIVSFTIDRDGRVHSPRVEQSSGWPLLDDSVLKGIERTKQVKKLPPKYTASQVRVIFPFLHEYP